MVKLSFNRGQIGEDVGVVEFQIVEYHGARMVMHELGTFVEERGVVFVRLDDEKRRLGNTRRDVEILWHAADQKAGVQPRVFQYPGQHRRGGGLAVRARYAQHPAVAQQRFREPLRAGDIRQIAAHDLFHQRIAARDHITYYINIRVEFELFHAETGDQLDALCLKLRTHRRIDIGVATGDVVTRLLGDRRDAAHESAADAEDVDVCWFLHSHLKKQLINEILQKLSVHKRHEKHENTT